MPILDDRDRRIVDALQDGLPICERPFLEVADDLGLEEAELISSVGRLLHGGMLTRFGPMFDVERLGGTFVLAALAVPAADFDRVAGIVNARPEIAHNYERDHRYNMWFVVATERPEQAGETLSRIERETGYPVLALPKETEYRISLRFDLKSRKARREREAGRPAGTPAPPGTPAPTGPPEPGVAAPKPPVANQDPITRAIVVATQAGLPLVERPFHAVADQLGLTADDVLNQFVGMQMTGVVRRIAAVPNHYAVGVRANGMSVWDIADDAVDRWGRTLAGTAGVTHCYRRPRRLPHWPFNLFVMLHGPNRTDVERQAASLAELLGADARSHDTLFSTRILKKTGLRLHSREEAPECSD